MRTWIPLAVGVVYGLVLLVWAFICGAAGEGTFIPLAFATSPGWVLGMLADSSFVAGVGLALSPLFWGLALTLAFRKESTSTMWQLSTLLIAHYAGIILCFVYEPETPDRFQRAMDHLSGIVVCGFVLYGVGQIVLWVATFLAWRRLHATTAAVITS